MTRLVCTLAALASLAASPPPEMFAQAEPVAPTEVPRAAKQKPSAEQPATTQKPNTQPNTQQPAAQKPSVQQTPTQKPQKPNAQQQPAAEAQQAAAATEEESDAPLTPEEQKAIEAEAKRLRELEREYESLSGDPTRDRDASTANPSTPEGKSLFTAFIQMVLVLGAVCLLAYLVLGKLLPRLMRIEPPVAQRRILQVIDRLPLDQRRAILVLRIGDSYYLVGASEQGIALLSRLDSDDVTRALATAELNRPQLGKLAGVFMRRTEKS